MKGTTIQGIFGVAMLAALSTVAQTQTMKAGIPFTFEAGGRTMTAGVYSVYRSAGERSFVISNSQTHESVFLESQSDLDPKAEWQAREGGILQFACSYSCTLQRIWTHDGYLAHQFANPKPNHGKPTRLALIHVTVDSLK